MDGEGSAPLLEVRHLRVVQAIHEAGSVSLAARRLNLTQPAVSHTLRDLEDRLGVRLFDRGRRRTGATPEGLRLMEAAGVTALGGSDARRPEPQPGVGRAGSTTQARVVRCRLVLRPAATRLRRTLPSRRPRPTG